MRRLRISRCADPACEPLPAQQPVGHAHGHSCSWDWSLRGPIHCSRLPRPTPRGGDPDKQQQPQGDLREWQPPSDHGLHGGRKQLVRAHRCHRGLRIDDLERSCDEEHTTKHETCSSRNPVGGGGKPGFGADRSAQRDRSTSSAKSCLSAATGVPGVQITPPELRLNPITCAECPTSYPPLGSFFLPSMSTPTSLAARLIVDIGPV